ncbi:hypothetical protein GWE18_10170 [Bradyrhizobium sp. CSA112]|uniref:TrbI/VirB10 family protein n=1 Tax=Bradyrhizobium sp. CSA112 TaxID=2699170 RepID=UPI00319E60A0|nr:hypothetical protein [Bradyrhizobium sp. CSA112]
MQERGIVIPAAPLTDIQSDLPGQGTAQVTEHVYDTSIGKFLLVPRGARLIGSYDSQAAFENMGGWSAALRRVHSTCVFSWLAIDASSNSRRRTEMPGRIFVSRRISRRSVRLLA